MFSEKQVVIGLWLLNKCFYQKRLTYSKKHFSTTELVVRFEKPLFHTNLHNFVEGFYRKEFFLQDYCVSFAKFLDVCLRL